MDNSKIIKVKPNAKLKIFNSDIIFNLKRTQTFIVISETETHFFFIFDNNKISVLKNDIEYVTYKNRVLKFEELKKDEINNIFNNYEKLIKKAQLISSYLSKISVDCYNMSMYKMSELNIINTSEYLLLQKQYELDNKIVQCKVPKIYLWSHSWKKMIHKLSQ